MNSKITLYSDKELIEEIKRYSKKKETSVSKIVNDFFKALLLKDKKESKNFTPKSKKLYGILKDKGIKESDYKSHLEEKYL